VTVPALASACRNSECCGGFYEISISQFPDGSGARNRLNFGGARVDTYREAYDGASYLAGFGPGNVMSYCASCHGKDAKGDGPAANALKQAPADLTMLAKQNGGKYPSNKVSSILRGQTKLVAHGDQDMPVWGPVFWKMSQGH
jgi:mono/diheme cytochrome c family protein